MTAPVQAYDVLLLDLDGTVYLGGQVIEHAPRVLAAASELGVRNMFVTNNASRSPAEVAAVLTEMGMPATADDVLTSPQAASTMLAHSHPAGSPVLVIGAAALADAVTAVGLQPVTEAADRPVALVQGHSPDTGWRQLAEGCIALRTGADWVACNVDSTLPTDRGLLPGNGSMVAVLVTATGRQPRVAGKPNRPLLDEAVRRAGAQAPLVVGDRLDTDIEAGVAAGLPTLLVLTGVSTAADLLAAGPQCRPSHLAMDLRGLIEPDRVVRLDHPDRPNQPDHPSPPGPSIAPFAVRSAAAALQLSVGPDDGENPAPAATDRIDLLVLAELTRAAWASGTTRVEPTGDAAAVVLRRLGLRSVA